MTQRLSDKFAELRTSGNTAFNPFMMAGDPDMETALKLLKALPAAGADIIELGMPFSDPVADGPAVESAGLRALKSGMTLSKVLETVRRFRKENVDTPIILMGYYNPVYRYGVEKFAADAAQAGADGLIIVDLPPEEEAELTPHLEKNKLDLIRLIAPTTTPERQAYVTAHASGFVYYITVKGITGGATAGKAELSAALAALRKHTDLPIAVGFGIKTPDQAKAAAEVADAVVVGSAIVTKMAEDGVEAALQLTKELADAVHS